MQGKLLEIIFGLLIKLKWKYLIGSFVVVFFGTWWATRYFDPGDPVGSVRLYWWYFANNVFRGTYSGYNPTQTGAQVIWLFTQIATNLFAVALGFKILVFIVDFIQRKRRGKALIKMTDHIVFLGYRKGETEGIITQLLADFQSTKAKKVVLCTKHLQETPYPDDPNIEFVSGDTSSDAVLAQANVKAARTIVITGHEDARTMAVCLAVNHVLVKANRTDAHIVAYIDNKDNERFILKINPNIECVTSLRTMLIAQAVVNSGISPIIREVVDLDKRPSLFRVNIPEFVPRVSFAIVMDILLNVYKAIPIGIANDHSPHAPQLTLPSADSVIKGGMAIFYVSEYRIEGNIDWSLFEKALFVGVEAVTAKTSEVRESLAYAVATA